MLQETPCYERHFLFYVALSLFLLFFYQNLDIYISNSLFSVKAHLHIFTSKYSSIWQIDEICIHFVALNVKYLSTRNNIRSRNSRVELFPECDNLACVTGFIDNTVSIFLRADWFGFSRSCRIEKGCSSCYCQLRVIFLQRIHS